MTQPAEIMRQIESILGSITLEEAEAEKRRLESELHQTQAEIEKLSALIQLKRQVAAGANGTGGGGIPTLRQAVIAGMNEWQPGSFVRLAQLRERLVARGWISNSKSDSHRLQVMASDMVRKGQLLRPETGTYQLPPATGEEGDG